MVSVQKIILKWKTIIGDLYLPCNPLIILLFPIYAISSILEYAGILRRNFWSGMFLWIIDLHLPGTSPDTIFNKENTISTILSRLPIEVGKGYWIVSLGFMIISYAKLFQSYKVQSADEKIPAKKMLKVLCIVLMNIYISGPIFLWMVLHFVDRFTSYVVPDSALDIPSFPCLIYELVVNSILHDMFFYYIHRLLHTKLLYKHIHKIHHEFNTPSAILSVYSHPFENIFLNMWSAMGGFILIHGHLVSAFIWIIVSSVQSMIDHCGYDVPFFRSAHFHDHHHENFSSNYGLTGWMDYLHGTDASFRKSDNFKKCKFWIPFIKPREVAVKK